MNDVLKMKLKLCSIIQGLAAVMVFLLVVIIMVPSPYDLIFLGAQGTLLVVQVVLLVLVIKT